MSENSATSSESSAVEAATEGAERQPQEMVEISGNCKPPPSKNCPTDFTIIVKNHILRFEGDAVKLKVEDVPGFPGGIFTWRSDSRHLHLSADRGSEISVSGLIGVSKARNAEIVKVTRKAPGCDPITKDIKLTVVRVTFRKSLKTRFGYDDYDLTTPWRPEPKGRHYISVEGGKETFVEVKIEGGLVGSDLDFSTVGNTGLSSTLAPAPGTALFDLSITGGAPQKTPAILQAKCKPVKGVQDDPTLFGDIGLLVYPERVIKIAIGKFQGAATPTSPPDAEFGMRDPGLKYSLYKTILNTKLREAVVKFEMVDLFEDNSVAPCAFRSGTGTLTYDINSGDHGSDVVALKSIMSGSTRTGSRLTAGAASMVHVAIVPRMVSNYYLASAARSGTRSVTVVGSSVYFKDNQRSTIGTGDATEPLKITRVEGPRLHCEPLLNDHPAGAPIPFGAGAWSSDPVIIQEGDATKEETLWTIPHEVSHQQFRLLDIVDVKNIMHFMQHGGEHRLRYCPRYANYHGAPPQNQWEKIHSSDPAI